MCQVNLHQSLVKLLQVYSTWLSAAADGCLFLSIVTFLLKQNYSFPLSPTACLWGTVCFSVSKCFLVNTFVTIKRQICFYKIFKWSKTLSVSAGLIWSSAFGNIYVAVLGCKLCSYVRWGKIHLCDEALWNKTSLAAIYSRSPPPTVFPPSSLQPLFSFTLPLPLSLRVRQCLATCFTSRSRKCSSLVCTHFMWHFFLPCCVWIPSAVCRQCMSLVDFVWM